MPPVDNAAAVATPARVTRALLTCGGVAGPLFVGVAILEILTRPGFDLGRHPISLLSLGDFGWIQIANFIGSGLLTIGFALGVRRVLHGGPGGTWGPLLIGVYGTGLIVAGVFVPDPAWGFRRSAGRRPQPAELAFDAARRRCRGGLQCAQSGLFGVRPSIDGPRPAAVRPPMPSSPRWLP